MLIGAKQTAEPPPPAPASPRRRRWSAPTWDSIRPGGVDRPPVHPLARRTLGPHQRFVGDVEHGDPVASRERMPGRHSHDARLRMHQLRAEAGQVIGQPDESHVDQPFAQSRGLLPPVVSHGRPVHLPRSRRLLGEQVRPRRPVRGARGRGRPARDQGTHRRTRSIPDRIRRGGALRQTAAMPAYEATVGRVRTGLPDSDGSRRATPTRPRRPSSPPSPPRSRPCDCRSATTRPTRSRPTSKRPVPRHSHGRRSAGAPASTAEEHGRCQRPGPARR